MKNEIIMNLDRINVDLEGKSRTAWTTRIKNDLFEIGKRKGYGTCASGIECDTGEYLFDLILYKKSELIELESIELAMECEWNHAFTSIFYDFEKLLMTNARLRLFVCQASQEDIGKLESKFKSYIDNYTLLERGSAFLIAIWNNSEVKFKYIEFEK